jgi:chaperonin GroES
MSKLVPLDGRVVLKGVKPEEKTKSGIILPSADKEKPEVFEVVSVSQGKRMKDGKILPHLLHVGQKVVCSKYAGDDIKLDEIEYKIIGEDSVSAIVE